MSDYLYELARQLGSRVARLRDEQALRAIALLVATAEHESPADPSAVGARTAAHRDRGQSPPVDDHAARTDAAPVGPMGGDFFVGEG